VWGAAHLKGEPCSEASVCVHGCRHVCLYAAHLKGEPCSEASVCVCAWV